MAKRKKNAAILFAVAACAAQIVLFRHMVRMEEAIPVRILWTVLAVVVTLPLHEAIHWIVMVLCGMKDARIEFARDPLGLPSLRAIARGNVSGAKRVIVFLAPFLLLTVLPDVLFCTAGQIHLFFFIMAVCNAAGSCFDLAEVLVKQ